MSIGRDGVEAAAEQERPRTPTRLSVLSMLLTGAVALVLWLGFFTGVVDISCTHWVRGANIGHGLFTALLGGFGGTVLVLFVRKKRRLLAVVLLLTAATLCLAIAFVALDSATGLARYDCALSGPDSARRHFYYLYGLWGTEIAFLLWAGGRPGIQPRLRRARMFKIRGKGFTSSL